MNCLPRGATFGERLKARRRAAGLTLNDLANQTGLYAQRIGDYEQGVWQPTLLSLAKIV